MQLNRKRTGTVKARDTGEGPGGSRLQTELAGRILHLLKEQGAGPGHRAVARGIWRSNARPGARRWRWNSSR